jgi:hypothetical protein
LLCPAADTCLRQEPSSLAVAGYVRYLLLSGRTSLNLRCIQVSYVSRTPISLRLSRWAIAVISRSSLASINEYLPLKMKAEVNS